MFFTSPSRYLFAIGLPHQHLALEGSYPLSSDSIIKLPYSLHDHCRTSCSLRGFHTRRLRHSRQIRKQTDARDDRASPHFLRGQVPIGFRVGLFRFHSQLLTESLLISFASLIYMLKFRECIRYPRVDVEDANAWGSHFSWSYSLTPLLWSATYEFQSLGASFHLEGCATDIDRR